MISQPIYIEVDDYLYERITSVQYDNGTRFLDIHLLSNGKAIDLTGTRVVLSGEKPDGKEIFNNATMKDAANGNVVVELTEQVNAVPGHVKCQLEIYGEAGKLLTTKTFEIEVTKRYGSKTVASSSEFKALKDALDEVQNIDNRFAQTNAQLSQKASEKALAVERARIDNLANLSEGSTTGDAELIDMRIGADGVVYQSGGEALRSQVTRLNTHVLPSYYLDFPSRVSCLSPHNSKTFQATEDSLCVVEKIDNNNGNSGFDIELNPNITLIEFDLEQQNFGANLGLYYYQNESLKKVYQSYNLPVSEQVTNTRVSLRLDWETINTQMNANGYTGLRFIVWNAIGSKVGGYNHLTNIKINNHRSQEELNFSVKNIEMELPYLLRVGGVKISDVNNAATQVGEISKMLPWNASNVRYEDNQLSFSHNTSGNSGFRTPTFKISQDTVIRVSGTIASLVGQLSLNFAYKKLGQDGYSYNGIRLLKEAEEFTIDLSASSFIGKLDEFDLNSVFILFSNSGDMSVTFTALSVQILNSKFDGETLEEVLLEIKSGNEDYTNQVISGLTFDGVKKPKRIIATPSTLTRWGGSVISYVDDILTIEHTKNTGNTGAITPHFKSDTNFVVVSGKVVDFVIKDGGDSTSKYQVCVVGNKVSDSSNTYITHSYLPQQSGIFNTIIDLNNLAVYKDLDLTKPIQILLGSIGGPLSISIANFEVYESPLSQSEYAGDTLLETFINVEGELTRLKSEVAVLSEKESSNILVAPNESKFIMQVSNDGTLVCVPTIPSKVLFIGNSLLLGHGTFGMCATDSKNDYYYHVTQYLRQFHPDGVYDKLLGAPYEQTETQSGLDNWIEQNIKTKRTDYELVLVQLGDNVNNEIRNELFKTSCKNLLVAIRQHMPKARVVWAGEWYYTTQRQEIIAKACAETGSTFIDITDISKVQDNRGKIGDIITRDDGTTFEVISSGVASHPGNKGMKALADRIIEILFL